MNFKCCTMNVVGKVCSHYEYYGYTDKKNCVLVWKK